eukprot:gene3241-4056_t
MDYNKGIVYETIPTSSINPGNVEKKHVDTDEEDEHQEFLKSLDNEKSFVKHSKKHNYQKLKNQSSTTHDFQDIDIKIIDSSSNHTEFHQNEFQINLEYLDHFFNIDNNENFKSDQLKLESLLQTDFKNGLTVEEEENGFVKRREQFGTNRLPAVKQNSLFYYFMESIKDHTLILLSISAVVSLVIGIFWNKESGGWTEGTSILVTVLLVVTVTSLNNYSKEKQFQKLNSKKEDRMVKVLRGGVTKEVSVYDVNVGDIMYVEIGNIMPVDGILIEGYNVSTEESACTGESASIAKDPLGEKCKILSGSKIIEGYGKMVVVAVGVNCFYGKTMMSLRSEPERTPLMEKLDKLADKIGKIGLSLAVITFLVLVIKLSIIVLTTKGKHFDSEFFNSVVGYFITSVTIIVVVVPEGLPLAVTIALAYSMMKMFKDNNLVRKLEACETMGGVTSICSDKTGTLTQNKMTIVSGYTMGINIMERIEGIDYPDLLQKLDQTGGRKDILLESIELNSTAMERLNESTGEWEYYGNQTECSLLQFGKLIKKHNPNESNNLKVSISSTTSETRDKANIVHINPFTSHQKKMSTIIMLPDQVTYRYFIKGAPEIILSSCRYYIGSRGIVNEISEKRMNSLQEKTHKMASDSLRTICLAYTDTPQQHNWKQWQPTGLILIGIFGIRDPIRPEVPEAIRICQSSGINVRMITGDNMTTAKNIAQRLGILKSERDLYIEGSQFRTLSDLEMSILVPRIQVIARSTPLDKQLFVAKLKELGEIVAVTGDGTNDAPALNLANVGFAMGQMGTDVCKEASDIILMDDNFASIVSSVKWGRNVMESIQKFLQFQLTVNIVAVIVAFIGSVSNNEGISPLSAIQLLWINLIMDSFASLALATEQPREELLQRKVSKKKKPLISKYMWSNIIGQAMFQIVVMLVFLFVGQDIFNTKLYSVHHFTLIFNTFVFLQIFNEFNCRRITQKNILNGITRNWQFIAIITMTTVVQFVLVQYGTNFIKTDGLNLYEWGVTVGVSSLGLPIGFCIKLIHQSISKTKKKKSKLQKSNEKSSGLSSGKSRWNQSIKQIRLQLRVIDHFKKFGNDGDNKIHHLPLHLRSGSTTGCRSRRNSNVDKLTAIPNTTTTTTTTTMTNNLPTTTSGNILSSSSSSSINTDYLSSPEQQQIEFVSPPPQKNQLIMTPDLKKSPRSNDDQSTSNNEFIIDTESIIK